jgi:hypothetical protein
MYYIYHIPGVKVGCSLHPKRRVKRQGYSDFEILAEATDKITASNLEIKFQNQYGYTLDKVKYHQVDYKSMGHKGGAKCVELGHTKKLQNTGSKISAGLPRSEAQINTFKEARKIGAPIAWSKDRTEKQLQSMLTAQKIGCVLGGKKMGAIMRDKLRVPISAFRKSDDSFVSEYYSVSECARELSIRACDIFACLNPNISQYSTKGYKFKKIVNGKLRNNNTLLHK